MKNKIISLVIIVASLLIGYKIYKYFYKKDKSLPFQTTKLKKKDIQQTIYASGTLRIKDVIKIGSLVAGTIKEIYVDEGESVKKGKLLALIDNGKGDTDVKIAKASFEKKEAYIKYIKKHFERQKELYKSKQISVDEFEKITSQLKIAKAERDVSMAELEKKQIEYSNTKIIAPENGIITKVGIAKGMRITTNLDATVLFKMAKDLTQMEAVLDIDESDISKINRNQIIKFSVDAYQGKKFKGKITKIGYSSKSKNNLQTYEAVAIVSNKDKILRPGMTVNAKIRSSKIKESNIINNQAFQISSKSLEIMAKSIKYKFQPIEKNKKKKIKKNYNKKNQIKFAWCRKDKKFTEKPVEIGIADDNNFQVINGLNELDEIVIDITESDEMEKLYKKMYGNAF